MIIDHPCLRLHLNAPILPRIRKVQPVHLLNIYSYIYSTYTHTYTQHILNHCRFCTSYQNQSISCSTHSEHSALPNQIQQNHSEHAALPNQNQQIHQNHIRAYPALPNQNHQIHSEHILLYPTRFSRITQSISCSTQPESPDSLRAYLALPTQSTSCSSQSRGTRGPSDWGGATRTRGQFRLGPPEPADGDQQEDQPERAQPSVGLLGHWQPRQQEDQPERGQPQPFLQQPRD